MPLAPDLWATVPAPVQAPRLDVVVAVGEAALRRSPPPSLLPTPQAG